MRIIELDLDRYGSFTGRKLVFRKGARLHLVYGPNEAGKSCSLSAITDLFFGIGKHTVYDFVHEGKNLSIGALIERQDGHRLAFHRRKGNKNTLIGAADQPLGDQALDSFLGSLSREVFCRAFGLNTHQLRDGAEEMLTSNGDVGASLFAAASGLRGLTELRRALDADADLIFAPRASQTRSFYQALGRFEEARKAIREGELRASDWKALNLTIDDDAARLAANKMSREAKEGERARLSRLKRVAPLVRIVDENLARLAKFDDVPQVPPGFAKNLRLNLEKGQVADQILTRCETAAAKAAQDVAGITVDSALIERAVDVQDLFSRTVAYADKLRDLPRINIEADGYAAQLTELSVRLGLTDRAAVVAARPSDAAQAMVRGLIDEGRNLIADLNRRKTVLSTERDALAAIERQVTQRGTVIDPRPLEHRFDALTPILREIHKNREAELEVQSERRDLEEAARRLIPQVCNLEMFATMALPGTETIARFRKQFDGFTADIQREIDTLTGTLKTAEQIEADLLRLDSGGPVATLEAITAKRHHRDREWTRLRVTLFAGIDALEGEQLSAAVKKFEQSTLEADHLADRASTDAERVAAHGLHCNQLSRERRKEAEIREHLLRLREHEFEVREKWASVWASVPVDLLSPPDMAAWLASLNGLLARREKLKRIEDGLAKSEFRTASVVSTLIAIANEAALTHIQDLGVGVLEAQIKTQLQSLGHRWREAGDLNTRAREGKKRVDKIAVEVAQLEQDHGEWFKRWCNDVPCISIPANVSPDAAEAALSAWKQVPDAIWELNNREQRVAGMERDIADFERKAEGAIEVLASDLTNTPPLIGVKLLNERLSRAIKEETTRVGAIKGLMQTKQEHEAARADALEQRQGLAELMRGLPPDLDAAEFLVRIEDREVVLGTLQERRSHLLNQAEGHGEENVRAELLDFDPDGATARLDLLGNEIEELVQDSQNVFAEYDRKKRDREALKKGVGAEVAVQQRKNAEAELAGAAREWSVLKMASLMLGGAVDRYRARRQDPLIARRARYSQL